MLLLRKANYFVVMKNNRASADIIGEKLFKRRNRMLTREQFVELAKQFQDMIFRLAFSYLKSAEDADDVTQEVLLRLYQSDRSFESNEHIRYWLVRVTINECKKIWRSP